jgi:hypothetical protein
VLSTPSEPLLPTPKQLIRTKGQKNPCLVITGRVRIANYACLVPLTSNTIRLAVTLFSCVFTGEGSIGYMGCDSTGHRGQRLEQ